MLYISKTLGSYLKKIFVSEIKLYESYLEHLVGLKPTFEEHTLFEQIKNIDYDIIDGFIYEYIRRCMLFYSEMQMKEAG